jgi:3-dehydroquinate dehydratase/shikimate dehydrogenase
MNKGRVCISICAGTASDLTSKIENAELLAEVVEARFDCLDGSEIEEALRVITGSPERYSRFLLATLRPLEQGGSRAISIEERRSFWSNVGSSSFWGADLEEDIIADSQIHHRKVCSFHDFSDEAKDLDAVYERMKATGAPILKIAVSCESVADAVPVWKLLEQAKADSREMIPIAMGEAGKWTRVLGPAHGAFMTYAALEGGSTTAPGQIPVSDLLDVFRVRELNEETEVYGIIAGNTSYSVSPWMHNAAFKAAGMNRVFVPLQTGDLPAFMHRMVNEETREVELNFRGFSVTNPHKQAIMRHLDSIEDSASKIGAVNTVKLEDGKLHGFNTDAPGFITPLKKAFGSLRDAHIGVAGAGGAARACIYALTQEGAMVSVFARDQKKARNIAAEFGANVGGLLADTDTLALDVVVNTTPLGTKGLEEDATIATAQNLRGVKLVYDLVYNPAETRLIREAKAAGVPAIGGLEMLLAQGAKQFEIWTGASAPVDEMSAAVRKKLGL